MEKENAAKAEEQKKIDALLSKAPELKCPMCGRAEFEMGLNHFAHVLQDSPGTVKINGRTLPTAYIICNNCGFVSQHALGRLGLMDLTKPVEGPSAGEVQTVSSPPPSKAEGVEAK